MSRREIRPRIPRGFDNRVKARYTPTGELYEVFRGPATGKIHLCPKGSSEVKQVLPERDAGELEVLE